MIWFVVGGDERQLYAAKALSAEDTVLLYGLGEAAKQVPQATVLPYPAREALRAVDAVLLPLPVLSGDGKLFAPFSQVKLSLAKLLQELPRDVVLYGGKWSPQAKALAEEQGFCTVDILQSETFALENAIPTAEGAIGFLIHELPATIEGLSVWLLGSGRVATVLRRKLTALGAQVTQVCRDETAAWWARQEGARTLRLTEMTRELPRAKVIINTIPARIFGEEELALLPQGAWMLELASAPYGLDPAAMPKGRKLVIASGLPGKCAPQRAGEIVAQTVRQLRREGAS